MADVTEHGGTDAWGAPEHDFSTNANACGPCPAAVAAVRAADASRYPDPSGFRLKAALAAFHQVDAARVLLLASASEGMWRFSAWAARQRGARVWLPVHHYGDLARAATALGLSRVNEAGTANLVWACEPSTPLGQSEPGLPERLAGLTAGQLLVLDQAYEPLRLTGSASLDAHGIDHVWRLLSPNKALGLTGVRAAYALAPRGGEPVVRELEALAPSWPLGAHGEAMLLAWTTAAAQDWLAGSRETLRGWKIRQVALCESLGFEVWAADANFFCARSPHPANLARLRQTHGVKLRDATSFGLPGWVRLGVRPPDSQDALARAWATTWKEE